METTLEILAALCSRLTKNPGDQRARRVAGRLQHRLVRHGASTSFYRENAAELGSLLRLLQRLDF